MISRFRALLERDDLLNIKWELWEVSVLLAAFTVAQLAFYICLPTMLRLSSAAALHLSLLSTDFYAIIAGVVLFKYKVRMLKGCVTQVLNFRKLTLRGCILKVL